ncbi:VRR-NUC domain-containing protein [Paraburkholderia phenazinium]|jgi:hypothetical protein|uniref:VRR-NUC domain-containing protein n=1 Tax=Paraburkholderia phenazinium TaxID=60549 RepID=A0A1G8KPC2_9BURK|nr:hypothetical protein SAMN05216466_12366 [Paraburkholderia phenazinium]
MMEMTMINETDEYTPGEGDIRRPNVVIVNNPSLPPTQDNIKNVVEIKFPPDKVDLKQQAAYEEIAGEPDKSVKWDRPIAGAPTATK